MYFKDGIIYLFTFCGYKGRVLNSKYEYEFFVTGDFFEQKQGVVLIG